MSKPDIDVGRLEEIKEEMLNLLDEAGRIMKEAGGVVYERAIGYWLAHIESAIHREHSYLGSSMFTMADSIKDLKKDEEEDEG